MAESSHRLSQRALRSSASVTSAGLRRPCAAGGGALSDGGAGRARFAAAGGGWAREAVEGGAGLAAIAPMSADDELPGRVA